MAFYLQQSIVKHRFLYYLYQEPCQLLGITAISFINNRVFYK